MDNKKMRVAAIAAVMRYIKNEEEAVSMQTMSQSSIPEQGVPIRLWGTSARISMMQTRNLMQMKTFHGTGLR